MEHQSGPSATTAPNADRILDNTLLDSDVQPKYLERSLEPVPKPETSVYQTAQVQCRKTGDARFGRWAAPQ